MISRKIKLENLKNGAAYGRQYAKLGAEQKSIIDRLVDQAEYQNADDWSHTVNRLFLDKNKPKNWALVLDILTALK